MSNINFTPQDINDILFPNCRKYSYLHNIYVRSFTWHLFTKIDNYKQMNFKNYLDKIVHYSIYYFREL